MIFPDFKELLSEFNAHGVRYLIVGGYAVSFHGHPRATKDLDIVISPDPENAKAVFAALAKFGFALGWQALRAKDTVAWLPGDEFEAARLHGGNAD